MNQRQKHVDHIDSYNFWRSLLSFLSFFSAIRALIYSRSYACRHEIFHNQHKKKNSNCQKHLFSRVPFMLTHPEQQWQEPQNKMLKLIEERKGKQFHLSSEWYCYGSSGVCDGKVGGLITILPRRILFASPHMRVIPNLAAVGIRDIASRRGGVPPHRRSTERRVHDKMLNWFGNHYMNTHICGVRVSEWCARRNA